MPQDIWPALPFAEWKETAKTLHMWTQVVGKIRLTLTPWINHSWHVTLYITARGLTTSPMYVGSRALEIELDFGKHEWLILGTTAVSSLKWPDGPGPSHNTQGRDSARPSSKTVQLA